MRQLIIAGPAARDLGDIIEHIAFDNPVAAHSVYQRITRAAARLPQLSSLGRPGRYPGTRELSTPGLPYVIVYVVTDDTVTVVAVFHTSRNLPQALRDRLKGE